MARLYRRRRTRRLRFRPRRVRLYRRRRYRRRSTRRRVHSRSSARSFTTFSSITVSPGRIASQAARGWVPLALPLASLPGFDEYRQVYSRVRILSCSATVIANEDASIGIPAAVFTAPSYDYVQSALFTDRDEGDPGAVQPAVVTFGLYDTITNAGTDGVHGIELGAEVDGVKVESATKPVDIELGCSLQATQNPSNPYEPLQSVRSNNVATTSPVAGTQAGLYTLLRARSTVRGLPNDEAITSTIQIPRQAAATPDAKFVLPPASLQQLEQLKRFRYIYPNLMSRKVRIPIRWYGFTNLGGPYTRTGDLASYPKYFSTRRFMPLQWFDSTGGKDMYLFGPFLGYLMDDPDPDRVVQMNIVFHIRLQFAGQV